jgi:regulator of protease activity HflC (stomatin/prohibitin superfamily)
VLDRLIDFVLGVLDLFRFWEVIDHYEQGVVLRLGRFDRTITPGFHWILPFGIDSVLTDNVVPRTVKLDAQSLTTKDERNVVVSGVITARISDIEKALLNVEGVDHALRDSTYAAIASGVATASYSSLHTDEFMDSLTKVARKQAWRYGVEILRVQLVDVSLCRSLRLWNSGGGIT